MRRIKKGEWLGKVTEKRFMASVIKFAKVNKWRFYHVFDSRRSVAGWPDLVLLRGDRMVVAELKVGGKKPTAAQLEWLDAFQEVKGNVEVYLWRPEDWPVIESVLGRVVCDV